MKETKRNVRNTQYTHLSLHYLSATTYLCFQLLIFFRSLFFFFNDTATTEIYTLSLHDALPICVNLGDQPLTGPRGTLRSGARGLGRLLQARHLRSEEHTSELQSHSDLVCRLLLEKKKKKREKNKLKKSK